MRAVTILSSTLLLASLTGSAGCRYALAMVPPPSAPTVAVPLLPATSTTPRVIVVLWDGVRWQDVFDVEATVSPTRPAMGTLLSADDACWFGDRTAGSFVGTSSRVPLSLPGYQTLMLGRQSPCTDNDCDAVVDETFLDEVARRLPGASKQDVAAFGSWSRTARAFSSTPSRITVDAPADGPPTTGGPPWKNARFDDVTWQRAMAHLEAHRPRLLVVSLLDTDEWAHEGDVPHYLASLRRYEAQLQELRVTLKRLALADDTTVIVVADHGRDDGTGWPDHGDTEAGRAIFLGVFGNRIAGGGRVRGGPALDQRSLRATVIKLLLAPRAPETTASP